MSIHFKGVFMLPVLILAAAGSRGEDLPSAAVRILQANCAQCHSSSVKMSDLDVSLRDGLLKGGTRGSALAPGKPEASLIIQAIRRANKLAMPPAKALSAEEVSTLSRWVESGAPWPAENIAALRSVGSPWWSFRKPIRPPVPKSDGRWARNAIDEFVLEKLRREKLAPTHEADRTTLIRRLSFDLTGLPPAAEEIDAFVNDRRPDAYTELIERLLASGRYGEKWGRHWLDLVRF